MYTFRQLDAASHACNRIASRCLRRECLIQPSPLRVENLSAKPASIAEDAWRETGNCVGVSDVSPAGIS